MDSQVYLHNPTAGAPHSVQYKCMCAAAFLTSCVTVVWISNSDPCATAEHMLAHKCLHKWFSIAWRIVSHSGHHMELCIIMMHDGSSHRDLFVPHTGYNSESWGTENIWELYKNKVKNNKEKKGNFCFFLINDNICWTTNTMEWQRSHHMTNGVKSTGAGDSATHYCYLLVVIRLAGGYTVTPQSTSSFNKQQTNIFIS